MSSPISRQALKRLIKVIGEGCSWIKKLRANENDDSFIDKMSK